MQLNLLGFENNMRIQQKPAKICPICKGKKDKPVGNAVCCPFCQKKQREDYNPIGNDPERRKAREWCHEHFPGVRIGKEQERAWEQEFPDKKWRDLGKGQTQNPTQRKLFTTPSMALYDDAEAMRNAILSAKSSLPNLGANNKKIRVEDTSFYLAVASMPSDNIGRARAGATDYADDTRPNSILTYVPFAEGTLARMKMKKWENIAQRNEMEKAVRGEMFKILKPNLSVEGLAREVFHFANTSENKTSLKKAFIHACECVNAVLSPKD
jgi:hypothetical protein